MVIVTLAYESDCHNVIQNNHRNWDHTILPYIAACSTVIMSFFNMILLNEHDKEKVRTWY